MPDLGDGQVAAHPGDVDVRGPVRRGSPRTRGGVGCSAPSRSRIALTPWRAPAKPEQHSWCCRTSCGSADSRMGGVEVVCCGCYDWGSMVAPTALSAMLSSSRSLLTAFTNAGSRSCSLGRDSSSVHQWRASFASGSASGVRVRARGWAGTKTVIADPSDAGVVSAGCGSVLGPVSSRASLQSLSMMMLTLCTCSGVTHRTRPARWTATSWVKSQFCRRVLQKRL